MDIRKSFRSSIRRGTGETHFIMKKYSEVNFSAEIIKAALENLSYDNQCEGDRATFVFELIKLSKQKEKIRQKILQGLLSEMEDTWAADQLFEIALLFAKEGDTEFREAIYKRYAETSIDSSRWLGEDVILELDGLEGLLFIAERKGQIIKENPNVWEDSFLVDEFQKENPNIKVMKALKKAAVTNQYIKSYLDALLKNKIERRSVKRRKYNYDVVTDNIRANNNFALPSARAKDLSESDIKRIADDFKKFKLRITLEKYLRVFDGVKYPYNFDDIFVQAKRPYSNRDRLVEYAVNSLRYFKSNKIREFAIDKLSNNSKNPEIYTNLLIANYKNGDGKLLANIVSNTKNVNRIHDLACSYVEIYQANKTKDCRLPLLALYDKLNCGIHRKSIVDILNNNSVLCERIKKEIKYDSYLELRELANQKLAQ